MSRSRLAARMLRVIRKHALLAPTDRVALAVSGGPDSVALVWLVHELDRAGDLPGTIAGLIHMNHGLRGDEAARDERFCLALADRLGLPIDAATFDVAGAARAARRSIEATARDLRYQFFSDAAARLGATVVATGHTLDDQAETVLLRLLRGTGSRGLSGIRVRRGAFIRPLLTSRRDDLRRYLIARNEPFCEDSSNQSLAVPRNQVRHRLLPVIEDIAPGGIVALARVAALAAADEHYLQQAAVHAWPSVLRSRELNANGDAVVQLDVEALRRLPPALGRRVVRHALETVGVRGGFAASHVEAVRALAAGVRSHGHLDLPGVKVEGRGSALTMSAAGRHFEVRLSKFEVLLPVPGAIDVPEAGVRISADRLAGPATPSELSSGGDVAVLQASSVTLPLTVRSRRPGDRLRPLGAPGHRKLQDLLVDRKIPRDERDRVPIVVDGTGRIIWVGGLAMAEECRVTAPGTSVVVLKVHRKGSPT